MNTFKQFISEQVELKFETKFEQIQKSQYIIGYHLSRSADFVNEVLGNFKEKYGLHIGTKEQAIDIINDLREEFYGQLYLYKLKVKINNLNLKLMKDEDFMFAGSLHPESLEYDITAYINETEGMFQAGGPRLNQNQYDQFLQSQQNISLAVLNSSLISDVQLIKTFEEVKD